MNRLLIMGREFQKFDTHKKLSWGGFLCNIIKKRCSLLKSFLLGHGLEICIFIDYFCFFGSIASSYWFQFFWTLVQLKALYVLKILRLVIFRPYYKKYWFIYILKFLFKQDRKQIICWNFQNLIKVLHFFFFCEALIFFQWI